MAIQPGKRYLARALPATLVRDHSSKKGTPYIAFLLRTEPNDKGYRGGEEAKCTLYRTEKTAERVRTSLMLCGWKEGEGLPGSLGSTTVEIDVKEDDYGIKAEIVDPNFLPPGIDETEIPDFDREFLTFIGAPAPSTKNDAADQPFDVRPKTVASKDDLPF